MRIISGRFRSRKLKSVPGMSVRPTPDRLRESMFSVLTPWMDGCTFVDAFAGSGAVGFEALSRGARRVVLIEKSAAAFSVVCENAAVLGVESEVEVVRGNAAALLPNYPADLIFIDPPYEAVDEYGRSLEAVDLNEGGRVIAQHPSRLKLTETTKSLQSIRTLRQGDNALTFYGSLAIKL